MLVTSHPILALSLSLPLFLSYNFQYKIYISSISLAVLIISIKGLSTMYHERRATSKQIEFTIKFNLNLRWELHLPTHEFQRVFPIRTGRRRKGRSLVEFSRASALHSK